MARVVLITGGNIGPVAQTLAAARQALIAAVGAEECASTLRRSAPWGFEAKEQFLNQVLILHTSLSPEAVLQQALAIEARLGRQRTAGTTGYQSRPIDIDLLFYDDRVCATPTLTLPHPRIAERAFVLAPLCEIAPQWMHPTLHQTAAELYEALLQGEKR
ncbi:MAG: 2-amino-4-hydroxy-6-hydroxymethyldihydropteridine diphosphokinase [Alistipes sp.]|nr:2-amino-4-hydroxy-6-hydroxymethyldihydropteridine diphosphokinase [Alistipes sp.]